MAFTIRTAGPDDAARLHALHTTSIRELCAGHYAPDVIGGWLAVLRPGGYLPEIARPELFMVEADASLAGFGKAVAGAIVAVYVDPRWVRRGVGAAIMSHALDIARRDHDGPIRLEATLNAARFYERFGFRESGRSTVRRGEVDVPVVLMERS